MQISVGVDLSYTRTGVSRIEETPSGALVFTDTFKTYTETPLIQRTADIKDWVLKSLHSGGRIDVIVIEGPALAGCMSPMMNGLDMTIMVAVYEEFPQSSLIIVPPLTLKKYEGVKGSSKSLVVAKAKECLPCNSKICHDEADAFFLALLGMDWLRLSTSVGIENVRENARHVLYGTDCNKKGKPRGLILREGEFFIPARERCFV
jgi:hypothetical protein